MVTIPREIDTSGLQSNNKQSPQSAALTDEQLQNLEQMTKEELITLVRRFACQCGAVAMMTKKETSQAVIDRLAAMVLYADREKTALRDVISAATTWLDRIEGRPKQTVEANINLSYAMLLDQINDERNKIVDLNPIDDRVK